MQVSFRAGQQTGSDIRAEHQKAIFTWFNTYLSQSIAKNSLQHYALMHRQIHSALQKPVCWSAATQEFADELY